MCRIIRKKLVLIDYGKCAICGNLIYHKKTLCLRHQKMYFETKNKRRISLKEFINQERLKIKNKKSLLCPPEYNNK